MMKLGTIRDENILTIVIPTAGRNTLERCLESMIPKNQGGWGLDTVVVADTYSGSNLHIVKALCDKYYADYMEVSLPYSDWGYPQIESIYKHRIPNGLYLMNIGDDDIMTPGIFTYMVQMLAQSPLQPHMFQAELYPSPHRGIALGQTNVIWNDSERTLRRGAVTGQNLVVPNVPHLMGNMTDDFEFIRQTIDNWQGHVTWIPKIICQCY